MEFSTTIKTMKYTKKTYLISSRLFRVMLFILILLTLALLPTRLSMGF